MYHIFIALGHKMMLVDIVPSTRPAKKLMAIFRDASGKTRVQGFHALLPRCQGARQEESNGCSGAVAHGTPEKGAVYRAPRSGRELDGSHDAGNARALHTME
jgi:hypothetical protein